MSTTTIIFLSTLATGLILQLWLYNRHSRHIAAHKKAVPLAFAEYITLPEHQKAADYTIAKVNLERIDLVLGTTVLLLWTLGGGLDYVLTLWQKFGLAPLWTGTLAILTVFFVGMVIDLPLSLWRTFRLEQAFGFNRTTPMTFIKDTLLGLFLSLLLGIPLLLAMLWLMEQAGSWWWLYAWGVWTVFTLLIMWAYPTLIMPLFNKFTPLADGELRTHIHALLTRCGFSSSGVFLMDGSKRSAHGNAYFTGLGRNKRIVLFDTLVDKLALAELEAVLAHELGHYRHHHIKISLLLNTAFTFTGFALLGWLATQPRFYHDLGVTQPSHAAALLLFLFVVPVFTQFLSPLMAWFMRRNEYQADSFAIAQANGRALINALVKLYKDNAGTLTPDPLFSMFHDSHPPAPLRIAHIEQRLSEAMN